MQKAQNQLLQKSYSKQDALIKIESISCQNQIEELVKLSQIFKLYNNQQIISSMASEAHSCWSRLQLNLQKIVNRRRNSKRSLVVAQMLDLVSAFDMMVNIKEEEITQSLCQILDLFQQMLKCCTDCSDYSQAQSNVKESLELFWEFMRVLSKSKQCRSKKVLAKLKALHLDIEKFAISIIRPHLPTMKNDKILSMFEELHKSLSFSTSYSWISILMLQELQKEHLKLEQILLQYSASFLGLDTMFEFEEGINSLWSLCGDPNYYLAPRVLRQLVVRYVKQFESTYRRDKKYTNHHWDPKIISCLLRKTLTLRSQVSFAELQKQDSEAVSNVNICSYCEEKIEDRHSQVYLLSISSCTYTIVACRACFDTTSKHSNSPHLNLLLALALSISDTNTTTYLNTLLMVQQLGLTINLDERPMRCESNKELKLYYAQIIKVITAEAIFVGLVDTLWAMLMILSNCDDSATRTKAVRMVGQLFEDCECLTDCESNKSLMLRIEKCLTNRLYDTEPKIKQSSLITLLSLTTVCSATLKPLLLPIHSEFIAPAFDTSSKGTNSNTPKFLQEVIEKLCSIIKDKRINQLWKANIEEFECWVLLLGQAVAAYDNLKVNSKSKAAKKSQYSAGISIVMKHTKTMRQYVKHYRSDSQQYLHFVQRVIGSNMSSSDPNSQVCYDNTIKVLTSVCGVDLECDEACIQVISQLFHYAGEQSTATGCLWINNSEVMESILNAREGELLARLVEDVSLACKTVGTDRQKYAIDRCINKCKILKAMLQSVESNVHQSFDKQKGQLQNLRQLLISQLLPESSTTITEELPADMLSSDRFDQSASDRTGMRSLDSKAKIVCSLIADIDIVVGDCSFTVTIYNNCWKIVQALAQQLRGSASTWRPEYFRNAQDMSSEPVQKMKLIIETAHMMLTLLPDLMRCIKAIYDRNPKQPKFETHVSQLHEYMKLILSYLGSPECPRFPLRQYLILHACLVLSTSHILYPNLLVSSEDLFPLLIDCPLIPSVKALQIDLLLSSLYSVLLSCESVDLLQKSRDVCRLVLSKAHDSPLDFLLNCKWTYGIAKLTVQKGLASWSSFNKIVMLGLIKGQNESTQSQKQIQNICSNILVSSAQDPHESRQLLSNFSESLKLITSFFHPCINHSLLFVTSQLCSAVPHSNLLSKHEQSQMYLRPSLFKAMADHLNKMVLSGKFLSPAPETIIEIRIICNTINSCSHITITDWGTLARGLMAILQMMYWEVARSLSPELSQHANVVNNGASLNLWNVMVSLSYLLARNAYHQVTTSVQKYFPVRDQIISLPNTQNRLNIEDEKSFEQLYDIILYGVESDESESLSSTEQTAESKGLLAKDNQRTNKTKIKQRGRPAKSVKNGNKTKKCIPKRQATARNYSAPKQIHFDEANDSQKLPQSNECVAEYKKKLRNKSKIILT